MKARDKTVRLAEAIIRFRAKRSRVFPAGMFDETAWEFLLALFVADAHGQPTNGRKIGEAIGAPHSVASRWLIFLCSEGLVDGDGSGNLDDSLTMSAAALDRMEVLLDQAKQLHAELLTDL